MKRSVFPIRQFPKVIRELATDAQEHMNFPVQYTAMAMLCAVAIAIGKTRVLRVSSTRVEKPIFYMAVIGVPGAIKSPAVRLAFKHMEERNAEVVNKFNESLRGGEPHKQSGQLLISDTTIEALFKAHRSNPVGVGYCCDELALWLGSMDKYRRNGNDVAVWLSLFNGDGVTVNRKCEEEILSLRDTCVSVIGSIQPDIFLGCFHGQLRSNGLLSRILQIYGNDSEDMPYDTNEGIDVSLIDRWNETIDLLLKGRISFEEHGSIEYVLSDEAAEEYKRWSDSTTDRMNSEEPLAMREFFAKMKYYIYRFALVLQVLFNCSAEEEKTGMVGPRAMQAAASLSDYFLFMAKKTVESLGSMSKLSIQPKRQLLYSSLPDIFTKEEANAVADKLGISESTVDKMCADEQGYTLRKTDRATYEKVL